MKILIILSFIMLLSMAMITNAVTTQNLIVKFTYKEVTIKVPIIE